MITYLVRAGCIPFLHLVTNVENVIFTLSFSGTADSKSSRNSSETACERNNFTLSFSFHVAIASAVSSVEGTARFYPSYTYPNFLANLVNADSTSAT